MATGLAGRSARRRALAIIALPACVALSSGCGLGIRAVRIYTIQPPAFLSNQTRLFALMASKNLARTLSEGLGPLAPSVFAMYALVERIVLDDARAAREFADLAVELDRRSRGTQSADVLFLKA